MPDFKSLNLAPPLNKALEALGYTTPTPIQLQSIPDVLTGRDLMGIAQTGTGKTAAFALPLLNHIALTDREPPKKSARVLILAPTRELASQIAVSIRDYGQEMDYLSVAVVFGGVPIQKQIKRLSGGNDIIVATPGRLIDLLDRKCLSLRDIEVLVLDEADQMMDMGFIHALKKIVPLLPKERQTLFFSATMVPAIKKLAGQFLTNPVTVSVAPANSTADNVEQRLTFVDKAEKQSLLALSLLDPAVQRALVFTRTKHGADRVVKRLAQIGLDSLAIHGNKSQGQRQRALAAFREDRIKILIATDVAARGIDIEGISHVFNFEIPNVPEQYVHRIGRTARANRSGIAHAFVDKDERSYLKDIQKLLKTTIPVIPLPEEFLQKARALKSRKPIVKAPQPKHEPRKGRGKSKKKARFSRDREKKADRPERKLSADGQAAQQQSRVSKDEKPHGHKPPKKKSWGSDSNEAERRRKKSKPTERPAKSHGESRAERKARNQETHAKEHSRKNKPHKDKRRKNNPSKSNSSKNKDQTGTTSEGPKAPQRYGKPGRRSFEKPSGRKATGGRKPSGAKRQQGKKPHHRKGPTTGKPKS